MDDASARAAASGIENFRVANWLKTQSEATLPATTIACLQQHGLILDTCLRQMCLAINAADHREIMLQAILPPRATVLRGAAAYRFALEVATGLRSAVPGETNVFGQFRKAWLAYQQVSRPTQLAGLIPIMNQLMNDSRLIRQRHLQGIGGASYGALVRRLLTPKRHERILFVGAGELAGSMLPYFENYAVGVWNRRIIRRTDLDAGRVFTPDEALDSARWADHVIIATPPDPQHDAEWRQRLAQTGVRSLLHLGHRRGGLGYWPTAAASFDLDDVFALRRKQAGIRSLQLSRASRACLDAANRMGEQTVPVPFALATA